MSTYIEGSPNSLNVSPRNLEAVYPPLPTGLSKTPQVVLPVGASRHVLLRGGPQAWVGKPSQFIRRAVSEDTDIVEVTLLEEVLHPHTGARVLCRSLGETEVRVSVGNLESSTNKWVKHLSLSSGLISVFQKTRFTVQENPSDLL